MYKIDNLKSIVTEQNKDPLDGFYIHENMKMLSSKLMSIENAFNEIRSGYHVDFEPVLPCTMNSDGSLFIKLYYQKELVYQQDTQYPFFNFEQTPSDSYRNDNTHYAEYEVNHAVYLQKEPQLYIQLVENDVIKAFLNHQKQINKVEALHNIQHQLRNFKNP